MVREKEINLLISFLFIMDINFANLFIKKIEKIYDIPIYL